jgi:hypothetical protein
MSITISKPTPDSLNTSIALILSVDQKTPLSAKDMSTSKRINEQESYAAIIHHSLATHKPKLAKRFEKELKGAHQQFIKNHDKKSDMFKISDRLMRQYVREKELSQDEYKTIKYNAFGHAQLDSDRTRISAERLEQAKDGDTPVRAISTFYKKIETNAAATPEEFAQFRAHEAKISITKWRAAHGGASPAEKTQNSSLIVNSSEIQTMASKELPRGFLWKPQSDSDGRLVVLLPPSLTSAVNSVRLKSSRGDTELDNGRYGGIGNGGRLHFRFGKSGASYPDGTIVEVLFTDGSKLRVPIGETSARVESK